MQGSKRLTVGLLSALALTLGLASGCSSRVTNLTPSALPREESGLYHFEVQWESTQRSLNLRRDEIRGFVAIDQKFHPLVRVPHMTNRWEAQVPIGTNRNPIFYRFKWEYGTAGFGHVNPNSQRSREYRLEILDSLPTR